MLPCQLTGLNLTCPVFAGSVFVTFLLGIRLATAFSFFIFSTSSPKEGRRERQSEIEAVARVAPGGDFGIELMEVTFDFVVFVDFIDIGDLCVGEALLLLRFDGDEVEDIIFFLLFT
mmetsp:Transcript_16224/g.33328  ORF Transcript_16224/g.33328 Transcript_16224/m.33328 type:complete len:117 (-) Transcript_16224:1146-1496(-)